MNLEVAKLADVVATQLELKPESWNQGFYYWKDGRPCCLVGQLEFIERSDPVVFGHMLTALRDEILATPGQEDPYPNRIRAVVLRWNDVPGRTVGEVIALLRKVSHANLV